jgi:hypothetical protein
VFDYIDDINSVRKQFKRLQMIKGGTKNSAKTDLLTMQKKIRGPERQRLT